MAKQGAKTGPKRKTIKPGSKIKIQIQTKDRPIPDGLKEIAEKLKKAVPGLNNTEEVNGENPKTYQGFMMARLIKTSVTKKGIFSLWFEVGSKA